MKAPSIVIAASALFLVGGATATRADIVEVDFSGTVTQSAGVYVGFGCTNLLGCVLAPGTPYDAELTFNTSLGTLTTSGNITELEGTGPTSPGIGASITLPGIGTINELGPDLSWRWPSRLVATAAEDRLIIERNLYTSFAVRWAAVSERPIWLAVIGWLRPIYWATFSPAFCGSSSSIFCGHGGCLLPRLRVCRKGTYRELMKRGSRAHVHHHQSLALGIGADALGGLYWLLD